MAFIPVLRQSFRTLFAPTDLLPGFRQMVALLIHVPSIGNGHEKERLAKRTGAASAGDNPTGQEVPEVLNFPWGKPTQTRTKEQKEADSHFRLYWGYFIPLFHSSNFNKQV